MKLWTSELKTKKRDIHSITQEAAPRVTKLFDLILIGVGSSIAVGNSVLIGDLIKCVTGPAAVLSIFLAGFAALIAGLCVAEFGVQFVKVDSAYCYSYSWGKATEAFIFGWALILEYIAGTASVAKGIISFTDALIDYKISDILRNTTSTPFPNVFPYFDYFSFGIILLVTIFIALGLKDSIILKKLFTICSTILLVLIIVAGAFRGDIKNWQSEKSLDGEFKRKNGFVPFGSLSVAKGAAAAFYGFIGFDTFCFSGNEIKKRKKNLPLAILATIFCTLVIFSGIGIVLTLMLPYTELDSHAALPFAFQRVGWITLKWVAVVAAFFAFQTSFFGVMFPLPRIIHGMANDGLLFYCLGNKYHRFKTSILSIMTGGLLAAVSAGIFTFQILVNLAAIGALFVYTILAINLIFLRYFSKSEKNEKESWKRLLCINNTKVPVKAIMQNYFNFKKRQPTDLTKIIITGNLMLFCICSIGLSIIFNFFYDFLVRGAAETVVSASILLCIMLFNITSIYCQPKSQEVVPFKVPLFPLIPCLSIFLNIFLMITFDSRTWVLFSSWMVIGTLLYFLWNYFKCFKTEVGKTSLYEINRTNTVKLNESIWKIKSDKKSFYEGAVNPVFSFSSDDNPNGEKDNADGEIKKENGKMSLQLNQVELIQRADSEVEEKIEQYNHKLKLNFIPEESDNNLEDESLKVHWECVAEIHTEEEFSPENIALEIVDNTYNFLSEVSEDMSKDVHTELVVSEKKFVDNTEKETLPYSFQLSETQNEHISLGNNIRNLEILKEKPLNEIQTNVNNKNMVKNEPRNENSGNFENEISILENHPDSLPDKSASEDSNLHFCNKNQQEEKLVHLIVETFYEAHSGEMISKQSGTTAAESTDEKTVKPILDEQNKIKNFKEKLNQLLKNQINSGATFTRNDSLSKLVDVNDSDLGNEINEDVTHNSIKTLNKSQIKDKLELLLARKPFTRPSLKNSFNISLNETNNENKLEKKNEDPQRVVNDSLNDSENKESPIKPSLSLADSIRDKILSLKHEESEANDISC